MPPGRGMTSTQPAAHGLALDPKRPGDAADRHALLAQTHRLLEARLPALPGVPRPALGSGDRWLGILAAVRVRGIVVGGRFDDDRCGGNLGRFIELTVMVVKHAP